jgi:hypothetical protein
MLKMTDVDRASRIAELQQQLAELNDAFRIEMQRRGFNPAQIENVALPTALARLFAERSQLESDLEELVFEQERENKQGNEVE